jgi:hypothetical protein
VQPSQGANFYAAQVMIAAQGAFGAPNVENPMIQVKLRPAGFQALANAQSVRKENHDQGCVPMSLSALARRFYQLIHFRFKKVFPLSWSALYYCSLYGDWHYVAHD